MQPGLCKLDYSTLWGGDGTPWTDTGMEKERVCIGRKRSRRGGSGYTPRLKGPSDIRAVDTERSVAVGVKVGARGRY